MRRFLLSLFLIGLVGLLGLSLYWNVRLASRPFRLNAAASDASPFDTQPFTPGSSSQKIVLISVRGAIDESNAGELGLSIVDDLRLALRQAAEDTKVKGVVLVMDSPGGEITASDSVYRMVRTLRARKPVVAYIAAMGTSGAYYVACGATSIMANDAGTTGSIGVIMQIIGYHQLLGKVGVEPLVFKSGRSKDILSGSRPLENVERDYLTMLVMQAYDKFLQVVAAERKIPKVTLAETAGDGRIMSGRDALHYKLVDANGTIDDAVARAKELAQAPDASVVRYVKPRSPFDLRALFGVSTAPTGLNVELSLFPQPKLQSGRVYVLPDFYAGQIR